MTKTCTHVKKGETLIKGKVVKSKILFRTILPQSDNSMVHILYFPHFRQLAYRRCAHRYIGWGKERNMSGKKDKKREG
jgi:hypothetical protein